jgi:LysM repeat protein
MKLLSFLFVVSSSLIGGLNLYGLPKVEMNSPKNFVVDGLWKIRMDINVDGTIARDAQDDAYTYCTLQLTSDGEDSFTGNFLGCKEGASINGHIYNDRLFSAVIYTNDPNHRNYYVLSGKITVDGSLKGFYTTEGCVEGDFYAERIQNGAANLADANSYYQTPQSETDNYPTYYEEPQKPVKAAAPMARPQATPARKQTPTEAKNVLDSDTSFYRDGAQYHIIGQGESLYRLSLRYGVTVKQLMAWNNKETPDLQIGEELRVSE